MPGLTRIISDIHFGHKASLVKRIEELSPLAEGVDHLIFNGDTVEQKFEDSPLHIDHPLPGIEEFAAFFEKLTPKVTYITGNHDPSVSKTHHCLLNSDSILVTHGDAIFSNVAPWSSVVEALDASLARNSHPEQEQTLSNRFKITKQISIDAHFKHFNHDPTVWGRLAIFLHQAWPPTRPFRIIKAWRETPDRAVKFAQNFGLPSKTIIIGHTHFPGFWKRGEYVVINTGSFFPWPCRYAVDLKGESLKVRRIVKQGERFQVGSIVKEFAAPTLGQIVTN